MSLKETVLKGFIKMAWPLIKSLLAMFAKEIIEYIFALAKSMLAKHQATKYNQKVEKATATCEKAEKATDSLEKQRLNDEAKLYKKEAELYKQFIEEQDEILNRAMETASEALEEKVEKLKAKDVISNKEEAKGQLTLSSNAQELLKIEAPATKEV